MRGWAEVVADRSPASRPCAFAAVEDVP